MTPHHLDALAAAHSLQAARTRLAHLAAAEARQNTDAALHAADGLRSTTYGQRHATGGHSDPVSGLLTAERRPVRVTRWADLLHRSSGKLDWLAGHLDRRSPEAAFGMDPIARILAVVPKVQPGTAALIARHLHDEDQWVRNAVGLDPDRQPLPGAPECPGCRQRRLELCTSGPETAWVVVCAARCLCGGAGCGCGMDGAVEGAPHIWPRAAVIGAVAGAAPTQPAN